MSLEKLIYLINFLIILTLGGSIEGIKADGEVSRWNAAERWARLPGRGRLVPVRNERPAHVSVQRG